MTWYIIKTEIGRERAVAAGIAALGHEVWLPLECRIAKAKGKIKTRVREYPALWQSLFAAVPVAVHGDLQRLEGFDAIWRDRALVAISVSQAEIDRFQERLTAHNLRINAHWERLQAKKQSRTVRRFRGFDELAAALKAMEGQKEAA